VSVVWKEETAVFVRGRVRVERAALEIAGEQIEVVEAAQDEAIPTPLPGEPPKAKNLLLGEDQSPLRARFPKAQEPGRHHPRDGRAKTVAAGR
jgi:hypothetical protein